MTSPFSRAMDYHVERQFRRDPGGRLVFLPFGSKGKAYFVDSKSDEEKIRSVVKSYRGRSALLSFLVYPCIYIPSFILNVYGSGTPLRSKLTLSIEISSFVLLAFLALLWRLWGVHKETVSGLTASLSEVGTDLRNHLSEISPAASLRARRLGLVCLSAGIVLMGLAILAATRYARPKPACPPEVTSSN